MTDAVLDQAAGGTSALASFRADLATQFLDTPGAVLPLARVTMSDGGALRAALVASMARVALLRRRQQLGPGSGIMHRVHKIIDRNRGRKPEGYFRGAPPKPHQLAKGMLTDDPRLRRQAVAALCFPEPERLAA